MILKTLLFVAVVIGCAVGLLIKAGKAAYSSSRESADIDLSSIKDLVEESWFDVRKDGQP